MINSNNITSNSNKATTQHQTTTTPTEDNKDLITTTNPQVISDHVRNMTT